MYGRTAVLTRPTFVYSKNMISFNMHSGPRRCRDFVWFPFYDDKAEVEKLREKLREVEGFPVSCLQSDLNAHIFM